MNAGTHFHPEEATMDPKIIERAAGCLAVAFAHDPVTSFMFPRASDRIQRLRSFYGVLLQQYSAIGGRVLLHQSGFAAAVYEPPGPKQLPAWRQLPTGLQMLTSLGTAMRRGLAIQRAFAAARPAEPHYYLALIGSTPESRGTGAAKSLLTAILDEADSQNMPVYLESSNVTNTPYYEKHGFTAAQEIHIRNGPFLWAMWRERNVNRSGTPFAVNRRVRQDLP